MMFFQAVERKIYDCYLLSNVAYSFLKTEVKNIYIFLIDKGFFSFFPAKFTELRT